MKDSIRWQWRLRRDLRLLVIEAVQHIQRRIDEIPIRRALQAKDWRGYAEARKAYWYRWERDHV